MTHVKNGLSRFPNQNSRYNISVLQATKVRSDLLAACERLFNNKECESGNSCTGYLAFGVGTPLTSNVEA